MFCNCTNLTDIIISESVENINFRAFESCINLKIINLPNNLTLISENVFNKCKKLNQIIIENDNILQNIKIEENAFSECNTDKIKIEIKNNIDNITKNTKEIDRDISKILHILFEYKKIKGGYINIKNRKRKKISTKNMVVMI